MLIAADRRNIETTPDFLAHERAVAHGREVVAAEVHLARALRTVADTKTFVAFGCASIEEYGVRLGRTHAETRRLVRLSYALEAPPLAAWQANESTPKTVEQAVLGGDLSIECASLAGRLLATPGLLREGENAIELASTMPTRRMRDLVRARVEELAQEQPVVPLAFAVTEKAKDGFARARVVASEQAGTMLTEGETFAVVVATYLDLFDPLRRGDAARRVPHTEDLPGQRYIPPRVKLEIRRRSGDRCEVPACCSEAFLAFAHVEPHREGGSREADNLLRACWTHHVLLDAERIRFGGWEDGRPWFRGPDGERVTEKPEWLGAGPTQDVLPGDRLDPGTGQVAERPPPYGQVVPRSNTGPPTIRDGHVRESGVEVCESASRRARSIQADGDAVGDGLRLSFAIRS
jgi:hypothetical protein